MAAKFLSALALTSFATAQTFTDCDPTKTTCKPDPALGGTIEIDFKKGQNPFFTPAQGTKVSYDPALGAVFTIEKEGEAPTISSTKYIFFGRIDVKVRASPGQGVVTSFVLQSDDLDEIDWEWLGGDKKQVQTNYFGKGCTQTYDRGGYSPVSSPQDNFDMYSINWTKDKLEWIINGNVVRTLLASDAKGCNSFPQTPMQIKLGTWVAGMKGAPEGTIQWAGGLTDFSQAPFIGYYDSVKIQDYANGVEGATSYEYGDKTGSWQSIKVLTGSKVVEPTTSSSASSNFSSSSYSPSEASKTLSSSTPILVSISSSSTSAPTGLLNDSGNGTVSSNNAPSSTSGATNNHTSTSHPSSVALKLGFTMGNMVVAGATVYLGSLLL